MIRKDQCQKYILTKIILVKHLEPVIVRKEGPNFCTIKESKAQHEAKI
jgi:hypothetical protein